MIMYNEFIFMAHIATISCIVLGCALLGKEALIAVISTFFLLANMFVIKQIELFGLNATGADAFIIGVGFAINVLQEKWGMQIARKSIIISLATSLIYLILSKFHLAYQAAPFDTTNPHFIILLENTTRIIAASFISYLCIQFVDTAIYGYLKQQTHVKYLILRNYASLLSSQFLDTILFSFLGLYGIVDNIWQIIFISYCIKVISIFLITPFMYIAKPILNFDKNTK